MSRRTVLVAGIALCLALPASAQTAGTGRLSGRLVETSGSGLPGVTVTLTGAEGARAITDAGGRFELEAFIDSAKSYTLTAYLAGFQTATKSVRVRPGAATALGDIVLRVGCLSEVMYVIRGIVDQARDSDLVAHVRLESVAPARNWPGDYACLKASEITASVLDSMSATPAKQIRFLVDDSFVNAYEPGDEIIAAFDWDKAAGRYRHNPPGPQIRVASGIATIDGLSQNENGLEPQMGVRQLLDRIQQLIAK